MDMKTKAKTFIATVAMGALTHLVTIQMGVFQQKLGITANDPQKMGIQIAEKVLKSDYTKMANNSVDKVLGVGKAVASENIQKLQKTARTPASAPKVELSKLDKKLCAFKSSYVSKDQELIKKNYRSLQEMYFKNKKMTEKAAKEFVSDLEGYLASGTYQNKKINCPQ